MAIMVDAAAGRGVMLLARFEPRLGGYRSRGPFQRRGPLLLREGN